MVNNKKIRLTKKRLEALNVVLSYDDILYEKFRRLNEDLMRREQRFAGRQRIGSIIQDKGEYQLRLQITKVVEYEDGLAIYVK